jgi:uncharacterized protein (DUF1697 family)
VVAVWISLLRAVNLGSRNKVNMPALRAALEDAGFTDVRTYVQSGNVVATSSHRSEAAVAEAVSAVLGASFGVDEPVVARNATAWQQVIEANPFGQRSYDDPRMTAVTFLPSKPGPHDVAKLKRAAGDDEIVVHGRELYLWYANGTHRSKLTPALLARELGVPGTSRNWRTVLAIADLIG